MFEKEPNANALELPPIAKTNPEAVEVLRVWAVTGGPQQFTLRTTWKDPGAWRLMLVDIARHVAKAYANEGKDPGVALERIHEFFEKEWASPTDEPKDIAP